MKSHLLLLLLTAVGLSGAADGPFYLPIRNNDLAEVRQLIKSPGAKTQDSRGNTPLMYAAALGSAESMKLLLDAGADPNVANNLGATPLMWCAGDAVKVRMLLAKGSKVNVRSKLGRTPLEIAAAWDGGLEAAKLLIGKGADVNATDEGDGTVLEAAAGANNVELARLLIEKGAKVGAVDKGGFTALHAAAGNSSDGGALVRLLLDHKAPVNVKSGDTSEVVKNGPILLGHLTPLHLAAEMGAFESVDALVKAGADIEASDVRNATPLVFAVATDHPDPRIVQLLLGKGAIKEPALPWVRKYQNPAILPLFGVKPSPLTNAALSPTRRAPREAIAKALAVSQSASAKFLPAGGCISCHSQNTNGLAVAGAKAVGVKFDEKIRTADAQATTSLRATLQEQLYQLLDPAPGVEGMQYSLLHLAADGAQPTLATDAMVVYIAAEQRKEGYWPYAQGRPPFEDGPIAETARSIRVLKLFPVNGRKAEFEERISRGAAFIEKAEPVTTEERSGQILGLVWAGRKAPASRVQALIARQRADGGWGQTDNLATDAYATGDALWALHEAGVAPSDPVYQRGVDFLLRTQKEDGSWHVASRSFAFQPYFQTGFPYEHDQWISQAGTDLAAMALSFAAK